MFKAKRILILILLTRMLAVSRCDCVTTYITICASVDEVQRQGNASWTELIITDDLCQEKSTVGRPGGFLNRQVFVQTPNLETIFVVEKVRKIEAGTFENLANLNYLKLYKNLIKVAPRGTFSGFRQLAKLDLQHNSIENLEPGSFSNSTIQSLDISRNLITNIKSGAVNLAGLRRFSISHNQLVHLAEFCFHEDLQHLDLSYNSLAHIDLGVLSGLKNLRTLILNNNRISAIVPIPFLTSLAVLDVSSNNLLNIEDKAFVGNLKLEKLYLHNNSIKYVGHTLFSRESKIEKLYLHKNLLTFLGGDLGDALPNLKTITIGGNPWACSCLNIIQAYFNLKDIQLEECDRKFFSNGENPVCFISESRECIGNEHVAIFKEELSTFRNNYKCNFSG